MSSKLHLPSPQMLCASRITRVTEHLFICGLSAVRADRLRQKRITTVVNVTLQDNGIYQRQSSDVTYVHVCIEDEPTAELSYYFDSVGERIDSTRARGGRTLVYCGAGVSRSATLCIAYLIKYHKLSLRDAYLHLHSLRPIIRPNVGFWRQLISYEEKVRGHSSTVKLRTNPETGEEIPDVYLKRTSAEKEYTTTSLCEDVQKHQQRPSSRRRSIINCDSLRPNSAAGGESISIYGENNDLDKYFGYTDLANGDYKDSMINNNPPRLGQRYSKHQYGDKGTGSPLFTYSTLNGSSGRGVSGGSKASHQYAFFTPPLNRRSSEFRILRPIPLTPDISSAGMRKKYSTSQYMVGMGGGARMDMGSRRPLGDTPHHILAHGGWGSRKASKSNGGVFGTFTALCDSFFPEL